MAESEHFGVSCFSWRRDCLSALISDRSKEYGLKSSYIDAVVVESASPAIIGQALRG
jgi:hypothetical protein